MRKAILFSVLASYLLLQGTAFIRFNSVRSDIFISPALYFIAVVSFQKIFRQYRLQVFLSFFLTIVLLIFLTWVLAGEKPNLGLPNICMMLIACFAAYIYSVIPNWPIRIVVVLSMISLGSLYYLVGFGYWINFENYHRFRQNAHQRIESNWAKNVTSDIGPTADKLILLDFYNTACPVCFRKFPVLQRMYDEHRNDTTFHIYAVNIPIDRDTPGMADAVVRKRNFSFPILVGKNKLDSFFDIRAYPTTVLLKNNEILFKGDIENVGTEIDKQMAIQRH